MRLHWASKYNNWGDVFTPFLLKSHGFSVEYSPRLKATAFGGGSIINRVPRENYTGVILGTAKHFDWETLPDLSKATVLGLRGKLTAGDLDVPLFDPGILAYLFYSKQTIEYDIGIIPYHWDTTLARKYPDAHFIHITRGIQYVIDEALKCKRIITSSLHGLVLSDSLEIPCITEIEEHRPTEFGFKFLDYKTVPVGEAKQNALRALKELKKYYRAKD